MWFYIFSNATHEQCTHTSQMKSERKRRTIGMHQISLRRSLFFRSLGFHCVLLLLSQVIDNKIQLRLTFFFFVCSPENVLSVHHFHDNNVCSIFFLCRAFSSCLTLAPVGTWNKAQIVVLIVIWFCFFSCACISPRNKRTYNDRLFCAADSVLCAHTREVKKHIVRTKDRLTKYFYYCYYYYFVNWERGNKLYGSQVER